MTGERHTGVVLGSREAELSGADDLRLLVDEAVAAEAHGFDSIWVGDSLARPRGDPLVLLGAVAAATQRAVLGTGVLAAALRPPLFTAHALATIDRLAAGRLVVAVGSGFPSEDTRAECRAAGADYRTRASTTDAHVGEWRRLWCASGDGDPNGPTSTVGPLRGARPHGPPVWLAGSSPRALARCAERYDGWLAYPPTPELYRRELEALRQHRERFGGPGLASACFITVVVDADRGRARRIADAYCRRYYGLALDLVEQVQAFACGPMEDVAAAVESYRDAGAQHVLLRIGLVDPRARRDLLAHLGDRVVQVQADRPDVDRPAARNR